jgi:uncharacterized repeat protein (TIGR03847 family)
MANVEIELDPVDFITVGTVGPKGRRIFHLQAGRGSQVVSLTIEKEQARALAETIGELLDELKERTEGRLATDPPDMNRLSMDLREPIDPQFRVAHLGLGYDDKRDMVLLVARELVVITNEEEQDPEITEAGIARFWASRQQMSALSLHTQDVVKQGRVDPQSNGRLLYYWT